LEKRKKSLASAGIRTQTIQPVAESVYRLSYPDSLHYHDKTKQNSWKNSQVRSPLKIKKKNMSETATGMPPSCKAVP
jgi:hypothetical protein